MENDFPYETLAGRSFELTGRRALVTGAGGHLGRAISKGLAAAGASVLLVGRNPAKLEAVAAEITAAGHQADIAAVDLTDMAALARFTENFNSREDRLDILVNNAYAGPTNTMTGATADEYGAAFHIAITVAAELVRGLLPALRAGVAQHGDASVINMSSMYGHVSPDPAIYGDSGQNSPPYYSAAKGGLIMYSRYAAVHLAADRIRVNTISPGPIPPMHFRQDKPEFYAQLVRKVPLRRIGQAEDLIGPVLFLASPYSQYVTGINLPVDGGWTAW